MRIIGRNCREAAASGRREAFKNGVCAVIMLKHIILNGIPSETLPQQQERGDSESWPFVAAERIFPNGPFRQSRL